MTTKQKVKGALLDILHLAEIWPWQKLHVFQTYIAIPWNVVTSWAHFIMSSCSFGIRLLVKFLITFLYPCT